jgi:hypothetical protein
MTIELPDIASRSSWGAQYGDGDKTLHGLADEVFFHHSVTRQLAANVSVAMEREQMRAIERIGQDRFGTGISYNVLVFPSGRPYRGVSWNRRGTHTGGRNSTSRSICLAGNYDIFAPTDAQIATVTRIFHGGKGSLWDAGAEIYPHRSVKATACPGKHAVLRLDDVRDGSTLVSNPKPPTAPLDPKPAPGRPHLVPDGRWGRATTMALQNELGTTMDGEVSSQRLAYRDDNPGLTTGWEWVREPRGSRVITALQAHIRMPKREHDGILGPDTIRSLQRYLKMPVIDGEIWNPSAVVRELQQRLNADTF